MRIDRLIGRAVPRAALAEQWPHLVALFVFLLALWAQADALVGVFYDDGVYVVLAKALAEGEGYRNIHLPGGPASVHYPILYPFALSLLWRLWPAFPANVALFQLFDCAALALAAWAIALHARRLPLPAPAAPLALLFGFTAFPLLTVVGVRFSEPFFLALWAGAVLLADADEVSDRRSALAGVLAGLSVLARSVGITVVAGVVLSLWLRGRRRAALISAAASAVLALPWFVYARLAKGAIDPRLRANYGTYFDEAGQAGLSGIMPSLDLGGLSVVGPAARLTLPGVPGWLWYPLAVLLLVVMVWGAAALARRAGALVASVAGYLVVIALWPFPPDRFVWILLPWGALFLAAGGLALWRRGLAGRVAVAALALAVAAGYLPREAASLGQRGFARPAERISESFEVLVQSITDETPDSVVIASADEPLMYLYTGRLAVPNHIFRWQGRETEPYPDDTTAAFLCDFGVDYLALTSPSDAAASLTEGLEPLFRLSGGPALFRFACPD